MIKPHWCGLPRVPVQPHLLNILFKDTHTATEHLIIRRIYIWSPNHLATIHKSIDDARTLGWINFRAVVSRALCVGERVNAQSVRCFHSRTAAGGVMKPAAAPPPPSSSSSPETDAIKTAGRSQQPRAHSHSMRKIAGFDCNTKFAMSQLNKIHTLWVCECARSTCRNARVVHLPAPYVCTSRVSFEMRSIMRAIDGTPSSIIYDQPMRNDCK